MCGLCSFLAGIDGCKGRLWLVIVCLPPGSRVVRTQCSAHFFFFSAGPQPRDQCHPYSGCYFPPHTLRKPPQRHTSECPLGCQGKQATSLTLLRIKQMFWSPLRRWGNRLTEIILPGAGEIALWLSVRWSSRGWSSVSRIHTGWFSISSGLFNHTHRHIQTHKTNINLF